MNKTIATAILGLAVSLTGSASAGESLEDGTYHFHTDSDGKELGGDIIIKWTGETYTPSGTNLKFRKNLDGDKIYTIHGVDGKGYVRAESSKNGALVTWDTENKNKATKWILHKWSSGWTWHHVDNPDNVQSFNYKKNNSQRLRRFNAGGKGNSDQIWQIKK